VVRGTAPRTYLREDLAGEAVLTVGAAVHEWRAGHVDGVVSVGPLECMPNKIAEAQLFHAAETEGVATLTIPVNADPLDPDNLDGFSYEVQSRFCERGGMDNRRECGPAVGTAGGRWDELATVSWRPAGPLRAGAVLAATSRASFCRDLRCQRGRGPQPKGRSVLRRARSRARVAVRC
jgi:hypothetical protein